MILLFQAYFLVAIFASLPRTDALPIRYPSTLGMVPFHLPTWEGIADIEVQLLAENSTVANNAVSRRQVSAPGYRIAQLSRYMPVIGARTFADGSHGLHPSHIENDGNNQPEVSNHKASERRSSTSTTKEKIISSNDNTPDPESIQVETEGALESASNTALGSKGTEPSNPIPAESPSIQSATLTSSDPTEHKQPPPKTQGSSPEDINKPTKSSLGDNELGNATVTRLPYTPSWCGLHVRQVYSYTCMRFNFKGCVSIISAITIFDAAQRLIGSANVTLTYDTTNTFSLKSVLPHPVVFTQLGILEGVVFAKESKPWETNMWPMRMNYNLREWRNDDAGPCRSGAWEHVNENRDFDCGFAC
ncbi:MAG: hypothetical protein Q9187_000758 [Circinaria calcarea]